MILKINLIEIFILYYVFTKIMIFLKTVNFQKKILSTDLLLVSLKFEPFPIIMTSDYIMW